MASETSASSRAISRGPFSTIVTRDAEAAERLGELEADVAAPDDDKVFGQGVEGQDRAVGQGRHGIDAGEPGDRGAGADVEEDALGRKASAADRDVARAGEAGVPFDQGDVGGAAEPVALALPRLQHDGVHAGLDPGHVGGDRAGDDAEVGGAASEVGDIGAGDQGLGRAAAGVDTGASEEAALDDRHLRAGGGQPDRERRAGLAAADDDCVEALGGHARPSRQRARG